MRADGGDASANIEISAGEQCLGQWTTPRRLVVAFDHRRLLRYGVIRGGEDRCHVIEHCPTSSAQPLPHIGELRIPHLERELGIGVKPAVRTSQQCVALLEHPFYLATKCRVTRVASRDGGINPAATQRRTALDQFEIIRREHSDLDDTEEITRPIHPLAIDLDPVAPHPWDLDLDELLSAVVGLDRRANHGSVGTKSDQGIVRSTPK